MNILIVIVVFPLARSSCSPTRVAGAFGACAVIAVAAGLAWGARRRKSVRLDPAGRVLEIIGSGEEHTIALKDVTEWLIHRPMVRGKGGPRPGAPRLAASLKGGGEIVLHEFRATWNDDAVARKAGEVVAKAARQPLRVAP